MSGAWGDGDGDAELWCKYIEDCEMNGIDITVQGSELQLWERVDMEHCSWLAAM